MPKANTGFGSRDVTMLIGGVMVVVFVVIGVLLFTSRNSSSNNNNLAASSTATAVASSGEATPNVILDASMSATLTAGTGNPDVALIDAGLTSADPLEIARQMRHLVPQMAIMILTPSEDEERLFQSIKVGAAAYYTRNITPEELTDAVRRVSHGEYLINDDVLSKPQLASRVLKSFRELSVEEEEAPSKDSYSPLSTREVEILDYIARGNSNKEIAKSLNR